MKAQAQELCVLVCGFVCSAVACILRALCPFETLAAEMRRFQNPVLPGFYPDPSVCRVGENFYVVTSSFAYFPGVPVFVSRDLVNFKQLGHCLTRESQCALATAPTWGGIWAPTIRHHQGTFYMTTTNVSSEDYFKDSGGNFIVTATSPEGPWSEPIFVAQPGIDPSLFFDEDGSVYYTTSHGGALQSLINLNTGELLSEPKVIWTGTGGQHPEGPHLYRRGEDYYLLISEGGTEYGHMITMARSRSPWGPFEPCPAGPLLSHRSKQSPIQGTGHADLVQTPDGDWFAVALAFRPQGYPPCYHLGRETFLCPVKWKEGEFPVFGENGHLKLEHETPLPLEESQPERARDDFEGSELGPAWNFLRNPDKALYSLKERPGHLRLKGGVANLDDVASPTWLGQRQRHFRVHVTTSVQFQPTSGQEEAGLTVWMNEKHHYEMFVTLRGGVSCVVLRRRIGSLRAEVASAPLAASASKMILRIEAEEQKYVFKFGAEGGDLRTLGEGETRYVSTEVAGGFTGVYFALYATGSGAVCSRPADFDWFEYREAPEPVPLRS